MDEAVNESLQDLFEAESELTLPEFVETPMIVATYKTITLSMRFTAGSIGLNGIEKITYGIDSDLEESFKELELDNALKLNYRYVLDITERGFTPGSSHTLTIQVLNSETIARPTKIIVPFTINQSFPENIKELSLSYDPKEITSKQFKICFTEPDDWGFWHKNRRGYLVTWLVSGSEQGAYFFSYRSSSSFVELYPILPDTINLENTLTQISVQTWVDDNFSERLVSTDKVVSNQIYVESETKKFYPVRAYLKTIDEKTKSARLSRISLIQNMFKK